MCANYNNNNKFKNKISHANILKNKYWQNVKI